MLASVIPKPAPPYSSGIKAARYPLSVSASTNSCGYFSCLSTSCQYRSGNPGKACVLLRESTAALLVPRRLIPCCVLRTSSNIKGRNYKSTAEDSMPVKPGWEGRYFEDFEVGDIYRCRLGRTVTENDNIWFTLLTNNTNQIHFNNEYGKRTEFGKCLINSALTLAIVAGMGVADVSENGFALGWDEIKLPNPLFAGDTLYSESEVLEKRESKSKPQLGIIKVRTRGIQQEGKIVIDYARSVMVWKRAHAPKQQLFPEIRS